jgi:hypothetical protein
VREHGCAAIGRAYLIHRSLDMLFKPVFGDSVMEQVMGVVGVAEHGSNAGVVNGYAFANRLSSEQKGAFLKKDFTILANKDMHRLPPSIETT